MVPVRKNISRRGWLLHLVATSLAYRKGRSLLLLGVLTMAASLVTSLGIVSTSMGKRVATELRNYGANLVITADAPRLEVGSGGLDFGTIADPAYLSQQQVQQVLQQSGSMIADYSSHLRGTLQLNGSGVPVEGVNFAEIRRLFPWWQLHGRWPLQGEAVLGSDLAEALAVHVGDTLNLSGLGRGETVRVAGIVSTGGEEDKLLFVEIASLQRALNLEGELSQVRLLAVIGEQKLATIATALQAVLPGTRVQEVRQVARTSEALLKKVELLMFLVTAMVLIAAGASVASTMSTTVLERTKEIGLMKAMGGSRRTVLLIFGSEALLLGILGGVAGWLVGNLLAVMVTSTVFAAPAELFPGFVLLAVAVSLLLALFGSVGPLLSVYRLDPVKSLRGE